jgi:7-carboxy-7-deazaguanine synthase
MSGNGESGLRPDRLKVTEIFLSVQGEARAAGWPTAFVRLTGCPLRCQYCDTAYAFHGGSWMALDDILAAVDRLQVRHVCVTGGEPLAQRNCLALLERLADEGYRVSLETSGALDFAQVDPRVSKVMDLKTPGSGECDRNRMANLQWLGSDDALKFVICDRSDYEWSREQVRTLSADCEVFFSPSWGQLEAADLADWLIEDRLPVRIQVQLHKVLWGDEPGR